jgi:hypothetical protein
MPLEPRNATWLRSRMSPRGPAASSRQIRFTSAGDVKMSSSPRTDMTRMPGMSSNASSCNIASLAPAADADVEASLFVNAPDHLLHPVVGPAVVICLSR